MFLICCLMSSGSEYRGSGLLQPLWVLSQLRNPSPLPPWRIELLESPENATQHRMACGQRWGRAEASEDGIFFLIYI